MSFEELLDQTIQLLQRRGRITYRGLKRQFGIDEDYLEDLKNELIHGQRVAVDEDDTVLVWRGADDSVPAATGTADDNAPPARQMPDAERRQLTVVFCDVVGSTALSERMDPEDLREVIRSYQDVCGRIVARHNGYVARYMGDGIMVYFGYPRSHENDAERAVRCGLKIIEGVTELMLPTQEHLQVRVGMATGLAVVGDIIGADASLERAVVGETPNVAARLQGLAEPNTVVIGANTRRLVAGLFELEDLGTHRVKGISEPVQAWRALRELSTASRFDAVHHGDMGAHLGRADEAAKLTQAWRKAREGAGQVLMISGEPGIGKSRIVKVLRDEIGEEPHHAVRLQCSSHFSNTALYPFVDYLQRASQMARDDDDQDRVAKLASLLSVAGEVPAERVALLAALLSIAPSDQFPLPELTPQVQRRRTLEAFVEQFDQLSRDKPVLLILEDLHWSDPTSLELTGLLMGRGQSLASLIALTFRPDFSPPWQLGNATTRVELSRLGPEDVRALATQVAGGKRLPDDVLTQIFEKTDGVPLFVEELTKAVLESDLIHEGAEGYTLSRPLPHLEIPTTLQDSLMARLDNLAPVREAAQIGAVIGRSFSYELLALVSPMRAGQLQIALQQLADAELVNPQGKPPESTYTFKHALVQDAAYGSLLRSRRQELHARIAELIEERFPETSETRPELVAWHYGEGQRSKRAVSWWQRAGQLAIQRSANLEAIQQLSNALGQLGHLPPSGEHEALELELRSLLGMALMATRGYAAEDVLINFGRARELCGALGESPRVFVVLFGLWLFHLVRADRDECSELAEEILSFAQKSGDSGLLVEATGASALTCFYRGQHVAARKHADEALSLYRFETHRRNVFVYGDDPGVYGHIYRALSLWFQGYPDQALESMQSGHALALEVRHPFTIAGTLAFLAQLHYLRREPEELEKVNDQCFTLSTEQGFPLFTSVSMLYRGWPLTLRGRVAEAVETVRRSILLFRATGALLNVHYFLSHLAEACLAAGQIDEGLAALDEADSLAQHNLDRYYEGELLRLRGALTLGGGNESAAETCFRQAMEIAAKQGARALELRAATSLARLLSQRDQREQARQVLAPVYDWFTEGHETGDIVDAREVLDELR